MTIDELIAILKNPHRYENEDGYYEPEELDEIDRLYEEEGSFHWEHHGHHAADAAILAFIASNFGKKGEEARRIFNAAGKWYS